jgi:hypothetical protein
VISATTRSHPAKLPIVIDPFSMLGNEVAGDTPDELASNLEYCCKISRIYRQSLQHDPPDLRKLFRGIKLSEPAKKSLRFADQTFKQAKPSRTK